MAVKHLGYSHAVAALLWNCFRRQLPTATSSSSACVLRQNAKTDTRSNKKGRAKEADELDPTCIPYTICYEMESRVRKVPGID